MQDVNLAEVVTTAQAAAGDGSDALAGSEDLGRRLRVAVVATNEDGSASAASAPSASVGASGVNRAATSTSKKGKQRAAAKAKAAKKKKAAAKQEGGRQEAGRGEEGHQGAPLGTMQGWPSRCAASSSSHRRSCATRTSSARSS